MTPQEFSNLRIAIGLSKTKLADALQTSRQSIINWETGTTPVPRHIQLAMKALNAGLS